jgi:hypothetical protein
MADKYTEHSKQKRGTCSISNWMNEFFFKKNHKSGQIIDCVDLNGDEKKCNLNSAAILFTDCKFMRTGTDKNHGSGGSNCITGKPWNFVDFGEYYEHIFLNKKKGILFSLNNCFLLPLFQLDKYPEFENAMNDTYASFISQRRGDNEHSITHVANGICCGLAAILFSLSSELVLNGTGQNSERLKFLIDAQYWLSRTAISLANFSPQCEKTFRLIPHVAKTTDTFQSIQMAFIFDEVPCDKVLATMLYSSISRFHKYEGKKTSYLKKQPVGLIGLLLIGPLLGSMISSEENHGVIINKIIEALENSVEEIICNFEKTDVHTENKAILHGFAKVSPVPLMKSDWISPIYDAVSGNKHDFCKLLGINENVSFVELNSTITLNNNRCRNNPVIINMKDNLSASWISEDPREWCGIKLNPGGKYSFKATPLGSSIFVFGNTQGMNNVSNFRFTSGNELMKGKYSGFASTGMKFDANTKKFTPSHDRINYDEDIIVTSDLSGIMISQGSTDFLHIVNDSDSALFPLLCFKNCSINVKLIETISLERLDVEESSQATEETEAETEINPCISLTEQLKNLGINTKNSEKSWGKISSDKLIESHKS